jgi:transposase InsO family protein
MSDSILLIATEVATKCKRSLLSVCVAMGIKRTTARRWLSRLRDGEALVMKRGPRVFVSEDMNVAIKSDMQGLRHGYHRTFGTTALFKKYKGSISRRDFGARVRGERRRVISISRNGHQRVSWHGSGIVWAMDDTEVTRDPAHGKIVLHQIRDLGSRYMYPPIESKNVPVMSAVAKNLDKLFKRNGAPLFAKRDNAGNFNNEEVDEVFAKYGVIPLTSPPAYPQFNGAEERGQGELKTELSRLLEDVSGWTLDTIAPFAHAAAMELNHMPRRSLKGSHACHINATTRLTFTITERKKIYDWIMDRRDCILQKGETNVSPESAWRIAAVQWLVQNGLITITVAEKVSPDSQVEK